MWVLPAKRIGVFLQFCFYLHNCCHKNAVFAATKNPLKARGQSFPKALGRKRKQALFMIGFYGGKIVNKHEAKFNIKQQWLLEPIS